MTQGRKFKRKVRERATGESYTTARMKLMEPNNVIKNDLRYVVNVMTVPGKLQTRVAETDSYRAALASAKVASDGYGRRVEVFDTVVGAGIAGYDEKGEFWEVDEL